MKRVAAARHPISKTALFLTALAVGCQKAPAEPRQTAAMSSAAVTPVAQASVAPKPAFPEPVWRFPAAPRVVAIGDLHGDLSAARSALRLAGAIDDKDRWVGGKLVVVQTGDQLDRGDHDRKILDLLEKLELDARAAGGALVVLNGNHEVMNVAGDFRYVTKPSFGEFAEFAVGSAPPAKPLPEFARGRALAFAPRGVYAKQLSARLTVAVVGDSLFVHGGILPAHVSYGIGRINAEVSAWMRGDLPELPRIVQSDDAPVWTRLYGEQEVSELACRALGEVLKSLSAKRLVIGHTVQKAGINAACNDQVYRIDVGLSRYYGEAPAQVLEIRDGTARVLTASAAAPVH